MENKIQVIITGLIKEQITVKVSQHCTSYPQNNKNIHNYTRQTMDGYSSCNETSMAFQDTYIILLFF